MKNLIIPFSIVFAGVILGGFYYFTETTKQQNVLDFNETLKVNERQLSEENERNRELCIMSVESNNSATWSSNCIRRAKEIELGIESCMEGGYLSETYCKSLWGEPDPSASCALPLELAESINRTYENEKSECINKYPY